MPPIRNDGSEVPRPSSRAGNRPVRAAFPGNRESRIGALDSGGAVKIFVDEQSRAFCPEMLNYETAGCRLSHKADYGKRS